jgi:hypothetical protein
MKTTKASIELRIAASPEELNSGKLYSKQMKEALRERVVF